MAKKDGKAEVERVPIKEKKTRIHINEFLFSLEEQLSSVQYAGFKVFCDNKEYMFKSEWEKALKGYLDR